MLGTHMEHNPVSQLPYLTSLTIGIGDLAQWFR